MKPILFSGEMVRAILEGRKTQTRRLITDQSRYSEFLNYPESFSPFSVGDVLYVREAFTISNYMDAIPFCSNAAYIENSKHIAMSMLREAMKHGFQPRVVFKADDKHEATEKFNPSLHMPKWASRILLEVTRVRVERACDISENDAVAEGVKSSLHFQKLWTDLYGPDAWEKWVWVYDLKPISPPCHPTHLNSESFINESAGAKEISK